MDAEGIPAQPEVGTGGCLDAQAFPLLPPAYSRFGLTKAYVEHMSTVRVDNSFDALSSIRGARRNQQGWNAIIQCDANGGDIRFQRLY